MSQATEGELKSLLTKGLSGDAAAYHEFLAKISVLLRQFVRRQLFRMRQAENDCEDIVQEALLALHRRRHTYDGETPVTAWAYGITRYKLVDSLRSKNRHADIESLEDNEVSIDTSVQTESKISVQKIMQLLPAKLRVPIELMKFEGLTALEASCRLGTSEATVRVNVHRGLNALARLCHVDRKVVDENG
jgi:RNA polymerase sigma-70 factor (ECF subfamily)